MRCSAILLASLLAGPRVLSAQLTASDRAALGDLAPQYAERLELHRGWYRGRPILYFDFGPQATTSLPAFFFVTSIDADGTPHFVDGQRPVFSSIPGIAGYGSIWQVQYVVVGPGYVANSVKDARQAVGLVLGGRARLLVPGIFVDDPIVAQGTSLVSDPDNRALATGWYKGAEVAYFDFGLTGTASAPIHPFVTGFDNDAPRFLRAQANVVDAVPGDGLAIRDFWDVVFAQVDTTYEPDHIRDMASLTAEVQAGRIALRRAEQIRNCPVVIVDGVRAPRRPFGP